MTTPQTPPPLPPSGVSTTPPAAPGSTPFGKGKLLAWGQLMVELIIAQVAMALGNIDVLGVHPFAFLTAWGVQLQQDASDAFIQSQAAQATADTALDTADDANTTAGTANTKADGILDMLDGIVPGTGAVVSFIGTAISAIPGVGPLIAALLGGLGAGGTGTTAVQNAFTDLLSLIGAPTGLGTGTPTLPGLSSIPLLGGLFSGGTLLSSLIPNIDGTKITTGVVALARLPASILTTASSIAASLISGVLSATNIPALDTSKTTTGTWADSFVPGLGSLRDTIGNALGVVGSGLSLANITSALSNIPGVNIASSLLAAVIPSLDASKITTGRLGTGLLPNITRSMSTDLQSTIDQFFQGYTGSGTTGNAPSVLNSSVAASINARITALEGGGTLTQYTTSATWTNPTPAAHNLITIICINGGQGGGKPGNQTGGGSPGISGGYKSQQFYTDQIAASYAMTIGAGGGGSTTAGAPGAAGGTTSMGGLLVGAAGVGSIIKADGTYSVAIPPGDGGFGAGGSTTSGGAAFHAENGQSGPFAAGGRGGLGAVGGTGTAAPSGVPSGGGGGGGGGVTGTATVSAGGAGGAPGGGGGGGGNIGTNEASGAAGAAGCIYVIT